MENKRDKIILKLNRLIKQINESKGNSPLVVEFINAFIEYDKETEFYISDLEEQSEQFHFELRDKPELLRSVCGLTGIAIKYLRTKGIQIK